MQGLLGLPVEMQRNIYQRVTREDILKLRQVNKSIRNAIAHDDDNVNSHFNRNWLEHQDDDEVLRVWELCVVRDGTSAYGEAVPGRRDLQFALLTNQGVRNTYSQTLLAVVLLRALQYGQDWWVSRLTSSDNELVPIHMTEADVSRLNAVYFDAQNMSSGSLNIRLQVPGRHESMAQLDFHPQTATFGGASRGLLSTLRRVVFPPTQRPVGEPPLPPAPLVFPAPGPVPAVRPGTGPPITLILGVPRGPESSLYRFVLGNRRNDWNTFPHDLMMLGVNPHAQSWDEMVIDGFRYGTPMDGFLQHLLTFPLVDMNRPDVSQTRPLYSACINSQRRVATMLLGRAELNVNLPGVVGQRDSPLNELASVLNPGMNDVFRLMLSHGSMENVRAFGVFSQVVRVICMQPSVPKSLVRLDMMEQNHKSVTADLLIHVLQTWRIELFKRLLAPPHPHTDFTADMAAEVLADACRRGTEDLSRRAVTVLLDYPARCPVQMTAVHVAQARAALGEDDPFFGHAEVQQGIRALLDAYVPV